MLLLTNALDYDAEAEQSDGVSLSEGELPDGSWARDGALSEGELDFM